MGDVFYMGTWRNKITKVRADRQYHAKKFRLGLESFGKTQALNKVWHD